VDKHTQAHVAAGSLTEITVDGVRFSLSLETLREAEILEFLLKAAGLTPGLQALAGLVSFCKDRVPADAAAAPAAEGQLDDDASSVGSGGARSTASGSSVASKRSASYSIGTAGAAHAHADWRAGGADLRDGDLERHDVQHAHQQRRREQQRHAGRVCRVLRYLGRR